MFVFAEHRNEQDLYSGGEDRPVTVLRVPVLVHLKLEIGAPISEAAIQARIAELLPEDDDVIFNITFS